MATPDRPRVALVCSEPFGATMAGIGLRYLGLAQALIESGFAPRIFAPERSGSDGKNWGVYEPCEPSRLAAFSQGARAVILQGEVGLAMMEHLPPHLPVAVDLYDPWVIEHLAYEDLVEVHESDRRAIGAYLDRGDFFMVANEAQRRFFQGCLLSAGRLDAHTCHRDPTLRDLIDLVPFLAPESMGPHAPLLDEGTVPRVLFGGIYDWLDPLTALRAMTLDPTGWQLIFVDSPNPDTTPQGVAARARQWTIEQGVADRVHFISWVAADRRFDLLRDAAVLLVLDRPGLETELSLRTRIVEAVACGVPVVASRGGVAATLLERTGAGLVVDPGDPVATARAVREAIATPERFHAGRADFLRPFRPPAAVAPLTRFLERSER